MPDPIFDHNKKPIQKPQESEAADKNKATQEKPLSDLQKQVGNQAVQRLILRRGQGEAEIREETAEEINAARGSGQVLDSDTQKEMGSAMEFDFGNVNVHTSPESDALNKELGAQAFTTGNDIFFSDGAYDPDTQSGQELLAHELTHVVQQGTGKASSSGSGMSVNAPGDVHEQEADSVAETLIAGNQQTPLQRQDDDELLSFKPAVQKQDEEDEGEEYVQTQEDEEYEEEIQE